MLTVVTTCGPFEPITVHSSVHTLNSVKLYNNKCSISWAAGLQGVGNNEGKTSWIQFSISCLHQPTSQGKLTALFSLVVSQKIVKNTNYKATIFAKFLGWRFLKSNLKCNVDESSSTPRIDLKHLRRFLCWSTFPTLYKTYWLYVHSVQCTKHTLQLSSVLPSVQCLAWVISLTDIPYSS